jgi:hypothetical protein
MTKKENNEVDKGEQAARVGSKKTGVFAASLCSAKGSRQPRPSHALRPAIYCHRFL